MKVYAAIQRYAAADATAGDWTAVADSLNSPVDIPINDLRTTRWLMQQLTDVVDTNTGATTADVVLSALQSSTHPRVIAALQVMSSNGIDLSDTQTQKMIEVIGNDAGWSAEFTDSIKALGFDSSTHATLAGIPGITAEQAESHYAAGQAVENDDVTYDQRRVLFCLNDGPVNDSMTLRVTPVGVVNGVEVKGTSQNVGGVASGLTGRELALFTDVQSRIDAYLGGN